jgi:hypothetical protein
MAFVKNEKKRFSKSKGVIMKITRRLGILILSIWLILVGLTELVKLNISGLGTIMAILALAAGVLLLLER